MIKPHLPPRDIGETDSQSGYTEESLREYGELCQQLALEEAIALIDILSGCSVEYIKDRLMDLMDLKG